MLTKNEGGVVVECSPEEEAAILAEWAANAKNPPLPVAQEPTVQDVLDALKTVAGIDLVPHLDALVAEKAAMRPVKP